MTKYKLTLRIMERRKHYRLILLVLLRSSVLLLFPSSRLVLSLKVIIPTTPQIIINSHHRERTSRLYFFNRNNQDDDIKRNDNVVINEETPKLPLNFIPQPSTLQIFGMYGIAPFIPFFVLPMLIDMYRTTQDPLNLLIVLIAKRAFIYILAILTVIYAGYRGAASVVNTASDPSTSSSSSVVIKAGESLDNLNREIFKGETPSYYYTEQKDDDVIIQQKEEEKKKDAIFSSLDKNENLGTNVALLLPFVFTVALSVSYFLLLNNNNESFILPPSSIDGSNNIVIANFLKAFFDNISLITNFMVCLLFSAAEFRSSSSYMTSLPTLPNDRNKSETSKTNWWNNLADNNLLLINLPNFIALGTVLSASYLPLKIAWPFQNSINIAISVMVTRALVPFLVPSSQDSFMIDDDGNNDKSSNINIESENIPRSIRTVALALIGLTVYDFFSVFGTPFLIASAQAAQETVDDITSTFSSSSSLIATLGSSSTYFADSSTSQQSVMETVARAKLQGAFWRPGLLEMVLVGRVSDVLGLGDIIFPACIVSWGIISDTSDYSSGNENGRKAHYTNASIIGYILGSLLTELVSTFGPTEIVNKGLPALVFITPVMLACITFVAIQREEMDLVWGTGGGEDYEISDK